MASSRRDATSWQRTDVTWRRRGPGYYTSALGEIRKEGRTWTWYPPTARALITRTGYRTLSWAKQDAALESRRGV